MSAQISLKEAERKAFVTSHNDGLADIFLGCFFLMFPVALWLGPSLGDFWSAVIMLPFWAFIYLLINRIRKEVVIPRLGEVKFGEKRKARLKNFTLGMAAINLLALVLGIIAAATFGRIPGQLITLIFGMILLIGFSFAAYLVDFPRLYIYGLLAGLSPVVGEWLWNRGYAPHHGFQVTFGSLSGIMIITGVVLFIRMLRLNPLPAEEEGDGPSEA